MFGLRKLASKALPLLVLIWATFAVLGGAAYIAKHSVPEAAAETGMGLCAATVAILFKKGVGRLRAPRFSVPLPGFAFRAAPTTTVQPVLPPPFPSKSTQLLQVFRT